VQEEDDIEEEFRKLVAEIRTCSVCGNRMTHYIRGMLQPGDYLLEHKYLKFIGGCIIDENDEDWSCKKCGHKVFD
jgi:DNA-directed RNA polymerase subunit RPC12/RpoP